MKNYWIENPDGEHMVSYSFYKPAKKKTEKNKILIYSDFLSPYKLIVFFSSLGSACEWIK
jgi:hypothetical protein